MYSEQAGWDLASVRRALARASAMVVVFAVAARFECKKPADGSGAAPTEDSLSYQCSAGRKYPANHRSHRASLHTRQNQIADLMEITSDKDAERANVLCWFK
jgi:hypothetical protein